MSMPDNPLLSALANRILKNLKFIEERAPAWNAACAASDEPPYSDTQLLISLLGVLIFPQERTPQALGQLLEGYPGALEKNITIRHPKSADGVVMIAGPDGDDHAIDPKSMKELPRLLRNSIAHFNIRPIGSDDGRFTGVRIWNVNKRSEITFIADLDFDRFRPLAEHILQILINHEGLKIDDPTDPLQRLAEKEKMTQDTEMAAEVEYPQPAHSEASTLPTKPTIRSI